MDKYFKKFSIIFIMLLAIIGVGAIEKATQVNAATIGQQLTQPESGWKRYDDTDGKIIYGSDFFNYPLSIFYDGTAKHNINVASSIKFYFYGTELRLYDSIAPNRKQGAKIYIDSNEAENISAYPASSGITTGVAPCLIYEKTGLTEKVHCVYIDIPEDNGKYFALDCLDIDDNGYLIDSKHSVTLNESSISLNVGESKQLTETTTPAGVQVTWKSSDESVATVDENGNVTGVKEGQVTITATINDGSNASATCTVNVIPKSTEPTEPQDPTGDGTLFIELVDGNIKSYDVSSQEVTNFINWYKNRDLDDSQLPVYKFKKGNYTDYVVHDKIDWFEVR
ncbi:Ig-like domain-containing protein [Clostridium beijerinckii]|uniref:Uncharacterized protein YjdB n=2 Tax=Clostridium beijerinckii TaxID=1520 RepID=A0AAX0B485_CLOBE|nr:Ig-like domain-containing protein [Clostridium beijerinckii]NRT90013.1 uncharacterized protein YjdB [Clostridium beijerinckii]NYC69544.1 uncharacterized protein YjdB [Clostridium beijerinckii]